MAVVGALLLLLGAVLGLYGVSNLSSAPEVVGGDAFNFIIGATRAVGWIAAGGVSALVGIGALLLRDPPAPSAEEEAAHVA